MVTPNECWLWRANDYQGKQGSWQACLGFKPEARFGGNEYIKMIPAPGEPTFVTTPAPDYTSLNGPAEYPETKTAIILDYHFQKEEDGTWILYSEWGGDIAYTPEIFEQYIRPHLRVVSGVGDHLFHGRDFSMDTVGFGKLPARLAIHFFGGQLHNVKVAFGGLDPLDYGVPVNQFTIRLPYMHDAPQIHTETEESDPATA